MTNAAYAAKDFTHAVQATINNPSMLSKRKELGEMIYRHIPRERLSEYFIGLTKYVQETPAISLLKVKNDMTVLSLLVQSFLAWLASLKYAKFKKDGKAEASKEAEEIEEELAALEEAVEKIGGESSRLSSSNVIVFNDETKREIIRLLAGIAFPLTNKILLLAIKALDVEPETAVEIVKSLVDQGKADFSSLIIILSEPIFNKLPLWPELLLQCILLGPVTSTQVESFAAGMSEAQRVIVRENLEAAEKWTYNAAGYKSAFEKFTHKSPETQPPFDVYRNQVLLLMSDLKHKTRGTTVDQAAAVGIIKTTAMKRYKKHEVNNEQFLDLIIAILKVQPSLKNFIIKIIEKQYNDVGLASRIKQLDFRNPSRLNIPFADADLYEIRDRYLSIPSNIKINIVNRAVQLEVVLHQLSEAEKSDYPYVGMDAEWSPFLAKSRASILQLALRSIIFIIDLDALIEEKKDAELSDFFNKLFGNEKLCKIGFRFSEDLTQLRACVPNCLSLYQPKNLICIQSLFFDLVNVVHETIGNDLDGLVVPSTDEFVPNPEISALEIELENPDFVETDIFRTREKLNFLLEGYKERDKIRQSEQEKGIASTQIKRLGLANVCCRVLGKGLDKSEQCSVWSRRPLRKTQLRYAALDAYCILMLLDKFLEFCQAKSLDIKPLIVKQPSLRASLPLFFTVS